MKWGKIFKFLFCIILCQLAGGLGAVFTTPSIPTWYAGLVKPSFNPPNWIFAPVWTTLYLMMAVSLFLIWNKGFSVTGAKRALFLFGGQLVLNVLWSLVFFKLHSPLAGFIIIIILWVMILSTILSFNRISRPASLFLIPYILWVSFASVLNFFLWRLNV
ncbi:MAG: tryptophan-rich sensory protein [bacterium]|nr:tryptophan-rich sensory protein [bacterium]